MTFKNLKRKAEAILTVLGMTRRGFFVPHRYASSVARIESYPELLPLFRAAEPSMRAVLAAIDRYGEMVSVFDGAKPPMPRWQQDWFPGLDGAVAYALVRERRPARVLEIGSGHSTRFLARAVADGGLDTEITCVDPVPRADLGRLDIRLHRQTLQEMALSSLPALSAGDMLVIDSSHLGLPGTDVDLLFSRIIPALPPGVLLHVHDVFLPDAYPESWTWRGYAEQMLVAAWLAAGSLDLVFASHYARTRMADAMAVGVAGQIPLGPGAFESSLWAVKTASSTIASPIT